MYSCLAFLTPVSFSIFDGVTTLTNESLLDNPEFYFSTDSVGQITGWNINIVEPFPVYAEIGDTRTAITTGNDGVGFPFDAGGLYNCGSRVDGSCIDEPISAGFVS